MAYQAPAGSRERVVYGLVGGTMFALLPYTQIALMPTNWCLSNPPLRSLQTTEFKYTKIDEFAK